MSSHPAWINKTKKCLCKLFEPGGEFSPNKLVETCTRAGMSPKNWGTAKKHLTELRNQIICGEKKLVKLDVEGKERWTEVVPDDPFTEDSTPPPETPIHERAAVCDPQEDLSPGELYLKYYAEALARFEREADEEEAERVAEEDMKLELRTKFLRMKSEETSKRSRARVDQPPLVLSSSTSRLSSS